MKKFKRLLAMFLAVTMIIGIVNLPTRLATAAAAQSATLSLSEGHCQVGLSRWLIYLNATGATISADRYWNNNTLYVDGEAHSGDGVNYAIDAATNRLMLCLTFDHAPNDGVTRTVVIPKGTVIGDIEVLNDFALVLGGDSTVYTATPIKLSYLGGTDQDSFTRYMLNFDAAGATDLTDSYWAGHNGMFENSVSINGNKVTGSQSGANINWGVNFVSGSTSAMTLFLDYSMIQSGVSQSANLDPFTLSIPRGTLFGNTSSKYLVAVDTVALEVDGATIKSAATPVTLTMAVDRGDIQIYNTPDGADVLTVGAYTPEDADSGIFLNGTKLEGITLYCYAIDGVTPHFHITQDTTGWNETTGNVLTIKGTFVKDDIRINVAEISTRFNGAAWEAYTAPAETPVTLTMANDRGDIQIYNTPDGADVITTGEYVPADAESGIFLNGTKLEGITLNCYATAAQAEKAHFHIMQDTTGWNETTGNVLTIKGTFVKDDITLSIAEISTEFNGNNWEAYTGPTYTLALSPTTEATGINVISANDLPYDTNWTYVYYPDAGDENGVFLNDQKTEVFLKKYTADKWYVCLVDKGISCEKFDKVTIQGSFTYTDSTGTPHSVKFDSFTVYRDDNEWSIEEPTVQAPMDQAEVTIYDLFELENLSVKTIPADSWYNLVDLQQSTNVGLRLNVEAIEAPNEVIFTLSKATANNVWVDSGYQIKLVPAVGQLRILTKADDIVATASDIDYSSDFELEFAVADMYAEGTTELMARRVYVKMNGVEILSYLDYDLTRELGTYSPAWAVQEVDVESVTHQGYELVSKTPNVQDISELIGGLSKVSTKAGDQVMVGSAANATNNAIRFKVDLGTEFATDGQEMKFAFSNNSIASMWALEDSGYHVALRPGQVLIQAGESDIVPVIVGCTIPEEEFILEIGTYDMEIQKDGVKVSDYARVVYVKINDQEVASWTDKDMSRSLGTNMWVYASADVEADLVSLTSDRYLVKDSAKIYDLFNTVKLSTVVLNQGRETELGETKESTNIALRTKVTIEGESSEFKLSLSKKVAGQYWDAEGSGWQFWFRPTSNQIYIGYGASEYAVLCGFEIPNEFILEIGERDTRYNNGEKYGREVYMSIDGVEVLSWIDQDYSRPLGTYLTAWASSDGVVTLNSLTTTGYIPVEKNIGANDLFDASGYAEIRVTPAECIHLGDMDSKNSAVKMKVDMTKTTSEFKIAIAKKDSTTIWDIDASGYQFWFRPTSNQVFIGYGMSEYATLVSHEYSESFILEVGSRDVYYKNGKHYGYQVYIKIDGEVVTSWIDTDASRRSMGTSIVAYGSADSDVVLSTLYDTYELPVVYQINGETHNTSDLAEVQAKVVLNKPSKITATIIQDPDYAMTYEGLTVGGEELTALEIASAPIGVYTYEATATKGDKVVVSLTTKELTVDDPETILDIYDVMKIPSIEVESSTDAHLGSTVDENGRNRINTAVQMKVEIPSNFNQIRWSMFSDVSSMWGYNGFIVKLLNNKVGIYYTAAESKLAEMNCTMIKPNSTLYVESGAVKCYENGNYKYDRYYVKVGETLESMELVCWFDSRERGSYGTTIAAYGMDVPGSYTISTVSDVKTITDVSTQANKDQLATYETFDTTNYAVYYPSSSYAYTDKTKVDTPATIKLYTQDGKKLKSLTVGGKNVTADVTKSADGGYVYVLPSVTSNIKFSYVIE